MFVGGERRLSGWNVATVLYALIAFAALAATLLAPGTIGHHWDWLIPSDPAELRRFAWTSGFAWQDFAYGSYVTYRYATTLTSFLFGAPGFVGLNGEFVTKSLLLLSVFGSGMGMRFLLLTLTREDPDRRDGAYATLGGLLYALAPYAYNQIIAGDQSALISDALSPIAIALAVRAAFARERIWLAYALGTALLLAIVVASAQVFAFTIALMWTVCLVLVRSARTAQRLALATGAGIALCAFWIVPAFLAGGAVHTVVQTASVDRAFATLQQFSNPLLTLTTIAFPGDFYLRALGRGAPLFFLAYAGLIALCVTAFVKRRTALLVALGIAFVLFAFLPLGGNPVLGPAILTVFRAFLPYSLFLRTPQHMMFVVSLVLPMLAYLSARVIPARFFAGSLAAGAVVFLAYSQGFFLHSDFFGLVGPFRETAGERATVDAAAFPGNEQYRTLFVPNAASFYFHPGIFDYYFEGADEAQVRFLPAMTMAAGSKWSPYDGAQALLKALDELVPDGADPRTQRMLLQLAGVKHIVVHGIGVPGAGVRLVNGTDRHYLENALRRSGVASLENQYEDRSIWLFRWPVTRAYAPDCVFGVPPRADPYDVLALTSAAAPCSRPATIAAGPSASSESIVSAATFGSRPDDGIALGIPRANVEIEPSNDGKGFYATVPAGAQEVETLRLPARPRNATGVAFRMYSSAPRRIWLQLSAPDLRNFFQTNVDFSGKVQDVAVNFNRFGRIGRPDVDRIDALRLASLNTQLRGVHVYFGDFHWIYTPQRSAAPRFLAIASNRWDEYYFGGERERVLFEAAPGLAPAYAKTTVASAGLYEVFARVQEFGRPFSLELSVDGRAGRCSSTPLRSDVSERLVPLARVALSAGVHSLSLRYCAAPLQPKTQDVGVASLIVAAARLMPPARRAGGTVGVVAESAGSIRLNATANLIAFSDSYDNRWSATQDGIALSHVVVNGYANGWIVPHPAAGDVILSFWPQRPFTLGMIVTAVLAALALGTIAFVVIGSRRRYVVVPQATAQG
ncbi:MAG TPA: hypothetical protein VGF86_00870 [Candidatus Tumulicola sp.]|jgi:hypothetical protein